MYPGWKGIGGSTGVEPTYQRKGQRNLNSSVFFFNFKSKTNTKG
jgi:hypothetical protein